MSSTVSPQSRRASARPSRRNSSRTQRQSARRAPTPRAPSCPRREWPNSAIRLPSTALSVCEVVDDAARAPRPRADRPPSSPRPGAVADVSADHAAVERVDAIGLNLGVADFRVAPAAVEDVGGHGRIRDRRSAAAETQQQDDRHGTARVRRQVQRERDPRRIGGGTDGADDELLRARDLRSRRQPTRGVDAGIRPKISVS